MYKEGTTPGVYDVLIGTKAVDENGKVSFTENLSIGKYKLSETKVPDGYTGSFEKEFEISDTAMTFVFDAVNTKQYGSYTITKKGSDGNLLPGVEFTLYDESNNVVAAKKTNASGIVLFDNLELGKEYTVKETKAPDGYTLNDTVYTIVIDATIDETTGKLTAWSISVNGATISGDDHTVKSTFTVTDDKPAIGTVKKVEIVNTKISNLPSTGGIGTTIFTIGGCVVMIAAAGLFFATRKKSAK